MLSSEGLEVAAGLIQFRKSIELVVAANLSSKSVKIRAFGSQLEPMNVQRLKLYKPWVPRIP